MKKKFTLMMFYKNINLISAGSEKFVKAQIAVFEECDVDTILLYPIRKSIGISKINIWGVMINDKVVDILQTDALIYILYRMINEGHELVGIYLHHLMNIDLRALSSILSVVKHGKLYIMVHDFYTACVQYNLLKNGEYYCGNALLTDGKCSNCKYYSESKRKKEQITDFFKGLSRLDLCFIAPSKFVEHLWKQAYPQYSGLIMTVPHQVLCGKYSGNKEVIEDWRSLRIAYIGAQSQTKGWNAWKNALKKLSENHSSYSLFYLGTGREKLNNVSNISVSIQRDGSTAMYDALRDNEIHVAVLNSTCPETYSYTYYECLAANTFVITNVCSGNIATQIRLRKNGVVMKNSEDIGTLLSDEIELRKMVNIYRKSDECGPEILQDRTDWVLHKYAIQDDTREHEHYKKTMLIRWIAIGLYNFRYGKVGQAVPFHSDWLR